MRPTVLILLAAALLLSGATSANEFDARKSAETASKGYLATRQSDLLWPYGGASRGKQTVMGVSLGGWLVLQPCIVPSVFDATGPVSNGILDEWTFASKQPREQATQILQKHLNTFITQADFNEIKAAGLNHVRIPIGFWAFETRGKEPYLKLNQWELLKQAVQWAAAANLKVLAELRGPPGPQELNGHDSARMRTSSQWPDEQSRIDRTLTIIRTIAAEFSKPEYRNAVSAIELLSEPAGIPIEVLKRYYSQGYGVVREHGNMLVVLSDGFQSPGSIALDSHIYTVYDERTLNLTSAQRQAYYCDKGMALQNSAGNKLYIVGEWSPDFTDCAKYLNARDLGSRYDGSFPGYTRIGSCEGKTGDGSKFSPTTKKRLARFWSVQRDAWGKTGGWIQWTWKTERSDEWSYKAGLVHGWIPKDAATGSVSDFHC